ncbi:dienelactone hydrolase family protein [Novosphingobium sp. FGD1]|uniref:Dienelactone hydrolase family protein n=1 Tax=Novosphingobium silvae TaxID=2692619 RepID=A0A7X4GGN5_9SPHN|nr:dienelactone hydrolase family protein [Novosphingobium silvae]MYL97244.1 dienelactone hydrolase family protein [Novosphingobium silvae]
MVNTATPAAGEPYEYADGSLRLRGELYRPVGPANGRAVLVVHEADGIGGNVRRHSRMLAELGYVVLAADMHGGGQVLEGDAMQEALKRFRSDPEQLRRRVRAGFDALAAIPGVASDRIVALGYCFGGFAVLELARSGATVRAVASFHGLLTTARPADADTLRARVAVYTGALDPLVPPEHVASFQAEMMQAGADWQMSIYGRALHSFTNNAVGGLGDPRMGYDREADDASWSAMLQFFDATFATDRP